MRSTETPWLDKILVTKDADGKIVPILGVDGNDLNGDHLYFPVLPAEAQYTEDGAIIPMLFEKDFAPGGKFYNRVKYAPGVSNVQFGVMPSGSELPMQPSEITYDDHRLNMMALCQLILRKGVPEGERAAAQKLATALAGKGIKAFPVFEPDDTEELYLPNAKGVKCRICNCGIRVKELRKEIDGKNNTFTVVLELNRKNALSTCRKIEVPIPEASLAQLSDYLGAQLPWFALAANTPGAAQLLVEYIRNQLDSVPRVTVYKKAGWHEDAGKHLFIADDLPAGEHARADCGKRLLFDSTLSPAQAFSEAYSILGIGKCTVTLPLLLIALLGPMFRLFEAGGYIPRFCGFLFGVSGSFKTSVAEVFYRFYDQQQHGSFRDTAAAIDVTIQAHHDQMLLVDDYQPAVIAAEGKAMAKVLEHLIRVFGDDVGKKRSNSHATATYGEKPKGSCLITGESISGSYSSLLRCLLIPISREDINGDLLRRYQDMPTLWTSNYYYMLPWIGRNWDVLVKKIRQGFPEWRKVFRTATQEPRLVDVGSVLMLVAEIFLEYGTSCAALTADAADVTLREWRSVIENLLIISTDSAQDRDVTTLAKEAILHGITMGSLEIAPDIERFRTGCDGFYYKARLWLHPHSFKRILRQYCTAQQVACVGDTRAVLAELYRHGLIVRDEESGKDSFLKRSPEIPAIGQRLRMLAFVQSELDHDE